MAQAVANPETFVTQLSLQMDEPDNWWKSLLEFRRIIQHVTDQGLFAEPYPNQTPQFLTSDFLTITPKVLAFPQLDSGWEKGAFLISPVQSFYFFNTRGSLQNGI
jgi:hypothetical protein